LSSKQFELTYPLSKYCETKSFHVISLYKVLLYVKYAAIPPPIRTARAVRLLKNEFLSPGVNLNSKPRQLPLPPLLPPDDEGGRGAPGPPGLGPGVGGLGGPPSGGISPGAGSFGGAGGR
jgi:hypothetical protein